MIFKNNASQVPVSVSFAKVKRFRGLPVIGAGLVLSLMTACASVDKQGQAKVADEREIPKQVESQPPQPEQVQPNLSLEESTEKAEEMMESLKAPLVEPEPTQDKQAEEEAITVETETTETETQAPVEVVVQNDVKDDVQPAEQAMALVEEQETLTEKEQELTKKVEVISSAKPLAFTESDLPATYDIWVLKYGETPLTKGLVISTPTWEMGKTGYTSQIWLTLKEDEIHINSSSDIATEVKGLGIRIDEGELIPFSRIAENNIGIVEGQWLDTLAGAKNLDIHLGFFPGKKPTSDNFKSNTSLDNLDRVIATYRKLSK